jgi:hypothetical protein
MSTEKDRMVNAMLEEIKMKPATLLKLKIEIDDSGYYYELDPTRDVTAYEAVLLFKLVTVAMNTETPIDLTKRYLKLNNLQRHFTKSNELVSDDDEYDEDDLGSDV